MGVISNRHETAHSLSHAPKIVATHPIGNRQFCSRVAVHGRLGAMVVDNQAYSHTPYGCRSLIVQSPAGQAKSDEA